MTVVDDGTLIDRRGSLNVDDEGHVSQRNVLIDDGVLVGYMQDKLNARLMGYQLLVMVVVRAMLTSRCRV